MEKVRAFQELKRLAVEASTVLGEKRAALVAGTDPSTIRSWMIRPTVIVQTATVQVILPRLRHWHIWLPGYLEEQAEVRRVETSLTEIAVISEELRQRVASANRSVPLDYLAAGCEVPDRVLMHCLLGMAPAQDQLQMVQALGHIRHLGSWPPPPVRKRVPAQPA